MTNTNPDNPTTTPADEKNANPAGSIIPQRDFFAEYTARRTADKMDRQYAMLDHFSRTMTFDYANDSQNFARLDDWIKNTWGIKPLHGNFLNADNKPFPNAQSLLNTLLLIRNKGYEGIASDEYKKVMSAWQSGDHKALREALGVSDVEQAFEPSEQMSLPTSTPNPIALATKKRKPEDVEDEMSAKLSAVIGQNFIKMMNVFGSDFDAQDKELIEAALKKGDGMPEEYQSHFASVLRESPEKANRMLALIDRSRLKDSHWVYDNIWRPLWSDGIWGSAKKQAAAITDIFTESINANAFYDTISESTDSYKYYWNEDERAEYDRLVKASRSYSAALVDRSLNDSPMMRTFRSGTTPIDEAQAKAMVDMQCARRLAREALPRAEQIRQRREQLLLEDAMGYKPTEEYGWFARAVSGAFSSVGYMATASLNGGLGFALNTMSQFQSIRDDLITQGANPDLAVGAQVFSAVVWSAIEKLEVSTAFGKPLTGLRWKQTWANIARAGWSTSRMIKIGKAIAAGSKEIAATTIAESIEEGLQGGVEGFTKEALKSRNLDKAVTAAINQTASDFVDSLGSMALIAGVGAAKKSINSHNQAKNVASLAEFLGAKLQAVNLMRGKNEETATPKEVKKGLDEARDIFKKHGNIADAIAELQEKYVLTDAEANKIADYFDLENVLLQVAREEGDTETALKLADLATGSPYKIGGPGGNFNPQDLYDIILPGTKVEDIEVDDPSKPLGIQKSPEQQAVEEQISSLQANLASAKVGSQRRGIERQIAKAKKRLSKLSQSAKPAFAKLKAQKVTLPNGRSYIIKSDTSAPNVHTASFAQSVENEMSGIFANDSLIAGESRPSIDARAMSDDEFKALPFAQKLDSVISAKQYMSLTNNEREQYLEKWGLAQGGNIQFLDESGRTSLSADAVVTIKRGMKRFVHRGGNWELAHEHGHFIARIASKSMTPEQIATMRRLFGNPTATNELWNEENANNQFAEFLRGKYDFKQTPRALRRAKMNWFQRFLDTIKDIFHLTGERPPETPIEKSQRAEAAEAAFNALANGDFSGLDKFAGITFTEEATPKPKKEESSENKAPSPKAENPAPTPSKNKPTNEPPKPKELNTDAPDTLPSEAIDNAARAITETPTKLTSSLPVRTGNKITINTPDYSMEVEAEIVWMPLSSIQESAGDRKIQMRDRSRLESDVQVHKISRKRTQKVNGNGVITYSGFNPHGLLPSDKSDLGAPIIGGGGHIISGHGRFRVLQALAEEGRFDEYLEAANRFANERGIQSAPEDMENPVLVSRITKIENRAALELFAEKSNKSGLLEKSESQETAEDALKITDNMLRLYNPSASGNLLAASNLPFMNAFMQAVGMTGGTNKNMKPTAKTAIRVQNAMLGAIFGMDENAMAIIDSIVENAEELPIEAVKAALIKNAGRLLSMKRKKGSFDIVNDVREAAYQYIAWRTAQQKSPKLTLLDHLNQQDLFSDSTPLIQQALSRLLDSGRFGAVLEKYNDLVAQQADDEQATFGIFERQTPLQLLAAAERAILPLKDGITEAKSDDDYLERPVTPSPDSAQAKEPTQTPPVVETPAPTPQDPIEKAQDIIAPPEPTTFIPVPSKRGTATLPRSDANGIMAHQVSADGSPSTTPRLLPPGAYNLLRSPYDVRKPPKPSAQDKAGRGLGIANPSPATDSKGKLWGKIFPHFQGNKTQMADRTSQAIRKNMSKAEREHYKTIVDYFGGGGCWGLYHALTNFENVNQLVINEFEPGRLTKIRLLHEHGENVADEAMNVIEKSGVLNEWREACRVGPNGEESGSGMTLKNKLAQFLDRFSEDALGLVMAIYDCANTMRANEQDELTGKGSFDAGLKKIIDTLREDGRKAKEAADQFKARGGRISYRQGDAASFYDAPSGHQVVAVCDPPYYLTTSYSADGKSAGIVPLDGDGWSYSQTRGLLNSLVDKGNAIIYTDEAWWNKEQYYPDQQTDFFNGGKSTFEREQETLLDIINTLDHFDVAGRVDGRQETLGIQHGHDQSATNSENANTDGSDVRQPQADQSGAADGNRSPVRGMARRPEDQVRRIRSRGESGGREGQIALAREAIIQNIDASIQDALPSSNPEDIDRLVRHSVRSVREDKISAYAKTVSKYAKPWLKRQVASLDKRMAEAGYTEKVWHGTGGGQFNVFAFKPTFGKLPTKQINMAWFSYFEPTAENYAAANSFYEPDSEDALIEGAQPDVRQYYVNKGKCLELDESESPLSYEEWIKTAEKAFDEGYDSILLKNALDDQGARLNADYTSFHYIGGDQKGPKGDTMDENEQNFKTDILVVFDHGNDNPGANRVKAADPVTFLSEEYGDLPIPLSMRANNSFADLRFSVTMGKKAREEARKTILKYRPDIGMTANGITPIGFKEDEIRAYDEEAEIQADIAVDAIASFPTPKERKAALYWFCKNTIRLPEDAPKVSEAIKTAERAKVDPFQFDRPGDILEQFAEYRPAEKAIDPDTVPELSDRREMGHGIVTYLVQDDKAGQAAMRRIINTHFGKDANPWCLLQGDGEGNLTKDAWHYWREYNAMPKRVAFKDGKLIAFMATDQYTHTESAISALREDLGYEPTEADIIEALGTGEQWWDRADKPHDNIPFTEKDAEGRTVSQELLRDGKTRITKMTRGNVKGDGTYEEWEDDEYVRVDRREGFKRLERRRLNNELIEINISRNNLRDNLDIYYYTDGVTPHIVYVTDDSHDISMSENISMSGDISDFCTYMESPEYKHIRIHRDEFLKLVEANIDAFEHDKPIVTLGTLNTRHSVTISPLDADTDPEAKAYLDALNRPDANERTTLLAPNGKRSNLTNALYHLVRTKRFKDWFGDWENDAANASKVVDENGEPLPMSVTYELNGRKPLKNLKTAWTAPTLPAELAKEISSWKQVSMSPYSYSFYDSHDISWSKKPNGSLRISNHWNFTSRGEVHCKTDIPIKNGEQWALGRYDADSGKYKILKVVDAKDDKSKSLQAQYDQSFDMMQKAWIDGKQNFKVFFNSEDGSIKSADPVTYDDAGITIPPSERFSNGDDIRYSVIAAGKYYGTKMRELAHGIKSGDKKAIEESAQTLADYVHDNAVLVPMPSHTGKATTMKTLANAIAKIRKDVKVVDALKADPHESNYTHKQRLHKPVAVTMHPTGAKIPEGRPVMVVDNVLASGTTARAALAVIPNADILVLGDASRVADPNEKLSPENENIRHSLIIGTKAKSRKDPGRIARLDTALEMYDGAGNYDDSTRDDIYIKTGWWMGVDGKWRVEIPNIKPKTKAGETEKPMFDDFKTINGLNHLTTKDGYFIYTTLKDLVRAPALFASYPQLKDLAVFINDPDSDRMKNVSAFYTGKNIHISWDHVEWINDEPSNLLIDRGIETLTHEIQHAVQDIEDFARGGSRQIHGRNNYFHLAGEVEARNAERRNGDMYTRIADPKADEDVRQWAVDHLFTPWMTEDVLQSRQIIAHDDDTMTDITGNSVQRHSVSSSRSTNKRTLVAAILAQRQLAGKEASIEEADKLLKNLGLIATPAADVLAESKQMADKNRERVQTIVEKNAPQLVQMMINNARQDELRDAINQAIAGTAEAISPDIGIKLQKAISSKQMRDLMSAKGFDAALMMAELPIDLVKGLLATAQRQKTPEEIAKLEADLLKRKQEREAKLAAMSDDEILASVDDPTYIPPSPEAKAAFDELMDRARFATEANQAEEERKKLAKQKKAAEAKDDEGEDGDKPDGASKNASPDDLMPLASIKRIAPVFDSPELFAQFIIEWTADHVLKKHPELPSTAEMWKNPVAIRELKQTATHILRALAKGALGSPSINYARNLADHAINALESDHAIKTFKSIRSRIAAIYESIHDAALNLNRKQLIHNLIYGRREKNSETGKYDTIPGIRQLAGAKGRFSNLTEEMQRTIDAKTEVWARRLIPYLTMSDEKVAEERERLSAIINVNTDEDAKHPTESQIAEATEKMELLMKYGGLVNRMPGEIADAADEIISLLNGKLQEFNLKKMRREEEDASVRQAIISAMEAGASATFRKKDGRLQRYMDSMQGNLTLEMQNLIRYCKDEAKRKDALQAIEVLQSWISEATAKYATTLGQAQAELRQGLAECYGSAEAGIKHLLREELPQDIAAKIFKKRDIVPTYGQLLQLYATTIQQDYKENADKYGRTEMIETMEETLTERDKRFHVFAVNWYKHNRQSLSAAVEEVTGLPVTSPDEMYCPARMENERTGFPADATAWTPIPSALNRRVRHGLDFNESANFLSLMQQQAEIRAQTIGYSAVGIRLREIIAHHDTIMSARKYVGKKDINIVLEHIRDVLVQSAAKKDESAFFASLNIARSWFARFSIALNVPSALKQLSSMPVWANAMLGGETIGLTRTMNYLATVATDEGRAAIKELCESDGFKARYVMGWSEETKNILMHPSKNIVGQLFDKGMILNKGMDAIACLWVAQGFYRDAKDHFARRGFDPERAKQMALAMTWSVLESTQQSGRIENMNRLQRNGGAPIAAVFQFKTAQLLMNNFLFQSIKELKAGTPGARGRFIRAAFINVVLSPALIEVVNLAWRLIMGDEPPEDEDKWPPWMKSLAWNMIDGVTAPMFLVSSAAHSVYSMLTGQWLPQSSGIPAADSTSRLFNNATEVIKDIGMTITAEEAEEELTTAKLQKDLWRLFGQFFAPIRHGKKAYDNHTKED